MQFAELGVAATYCNKNCLLDEGIYRPLRDAVPRFDAVYDARLSPVKRHLLASSVQRLALIYYPWPDDDAGYVAEVRRRLSHAHYFNHPDGGAFRMLSAAEVNACLNECRVGLCLSQEEGAMYASTQYLLSGLPIVTTPSLGGRDVWYEEGHVAIVPPDAAAVSDAVRELAARKVPRETIRKATLHKVAQHRNRFIGLVQSIYDQLGVDRCFADEWPRIFVNRMVQARNHLDTITRILAMPLAPVRSSAEDPS
jgi:glycosyltransferase involved in cell wall biosynthesis